MRLKKYLKGFFILGLILFLGTSDAVRTAPVAAYAGEVTQEVKLNVNSQTIVKGTSFSLYVYNLSEGQTVTYASSAPTIASVDENGLITANAVGDATIFVTVTEGEETKTTLPCEIKVGPPAISVQFARVELAMVVGQKLTLERIVQPLNSVETPKFSSQDRTIATVSAGGRVTAKAEGSTYIFAQINNGLFAVCKITVYADKLPEAAKTEEISEDITADSSNVEVKTSDEKKSEPAAVETSPTETTDGKAAKTNSSASDETPAESKETVDFVTFIKNLNSDGKASEEAKSTTDNAN